MLLIQKSLKYVTYYTVIILSLRKNITEGRDLKTNFSNTILLDFN